MTKHSLLVASLILAGTICSQGNLVVNSSVQNGPSAPAGSSTSVVNFYDGAPRGTPSTPRPAAAPSTPHPAGSTVTSPIPEPTAALFGLALCGFAAIRRRRRWPDSFSF